MLGGKGAYRRLKDLITKTNYINLEEDLITRQSITITARLVLQGTYKADYPELTIQIRRIQQTNPKLLNTVLLRSKRDFLN